MKVLNPQKHLVIGCLVHNKAKQNPAPTTIEDVTQEELAQYNCLAEKEWKRLEPAIQVANSRIKKILYPLVRSVEAQSTIATITCCFKSLNFNLPTQELHAKTYDRWADLLAEFLNNAQIDKKLGFWETYIGNSGIGSQGEINKQPHDEHILVIEHQLFEYNESSPLTEKLIVKPPQEQN